MKKNTFKHNFLSILKVSVFSLFFWGSIGVNAQVTQNDTLFISNDTYFYLGAGVGNYAFGVATDAASKSTRNASVYGKLIFESGVTSSGAYSNATNHHSFDGYVSTLSTDDFIMPIGQSSVYAPAKVNATAVTGVDAAYYDVVGLGLYGSTLGDNVTGLLAQGYWNIQRSTGSSANAKITLSWSSDISALVNTLDNLTIVGHTGVSSTKWDIIASTIASGTIEGSGTSNLTAGTIVTTNDVDLSQYKYFTLASKETCAPVVDPIALTATTWDGNDWSNGDPNEYSPAILTDDYSGNIIANSLDMGAFNVTLNDGEVMEIVKNVTSTTGKVIMSSKASLVQRDDSANAPMIELTKNTRSLARYNYIFFGSPVAGNIFSQLAGAYYQTPTNNNRLYNHYKFISGNELLFGEELVPANPYLTPWQALSSANFVSPGQGWISSISSIAPFNTDAFTGVISLKFSGIANNGVINATVLKSTHANIDHGSNFNLLANPYPSALNADKFIEENRDVDGVVYIWEAKTQPISIADTGFYEQSDYITYTKAGSTIPNPTSNIFNGKIPSGQGFMVRAEVNNGVVIFNNCMRLSSTSDNNFFYRTTSVSTQSESVIDRFKLNLTSSAGDFNQLLVAYIEGLTYDYDRGYDASKNSNASSQIFTLLGASNRKLGIDARPSFNDTDIVRLGFSTSTPLASTTFQINVVDKEGVFTNDDLDIFIFDRLNNTYHNFDNGSFNFTANQSELLNRFDVVYQSSTLDGPSFNDSDVFVSLNNDNLLLKSKEFMDDAYIFDITGRLIKKIEINGLTYSNDFIHAQGVYIVRVNFSNGKSVSNKVVNN